MSKLLNLFLIQFAVECSTAYHYNNFPYATGWGNAPRYPDWCCPLEWTNMTQGHQLPADWIKAGTFLDRDFAFARRIPDFRAAIKSSNVEDLAYTHGYGSVPNPFPILTNPNKCKLDWYTTKYFKEIPRPNHGTFYPTTGLTPYGSYAQYQNIPGWMFKDGNFLKMKSLSDWEWFKGSGIKLLYVDCINSVRTMAVSKLVKLTFDQEKFDKIKDIKVRKQSVRKTYINNNPRDSRTSFKFSVRTIDAINLTLTSNYSSAFNPNIDTYQDWIDSQRVNDLLNDARFHNGITDHADLWSTGINQNNNDIFSVRHQEQFDFEQDITIPATTTVTVTAFSNPVIGRIPFEAVYELTPIKAGDNLINTKVLNETLSRYGKQNVIEITNRGTVLVTFDGVININAGNDVHLDIQSVPIDNKSESVGFPMTNGTIY